MFETVNVCSRMLRVELADRSPGEKQRGDLWKSWNWTWSQRRRGGKGFSRLDRSKRLPAIEDDAGLGNNKNKSKYLKKKYVWAQTKGSYEKMLKQNAKDGFKPRLWPIKPIYMLWLTQLISWVGKNRNKKNKKKQVLFLFPTFCHSVKLQKEETEEVDLWIKPHQILSNGRQSRREAGGTRQH